MANFVENDPATVANRLRAVQKVTDSARMEPIIATLSRGIVDPVTGQVVAEVMASSLVNTATNEAYLVNTEVAPDYAFAGGVAHSSSFAFGEGAVAWDLSCAVGSNAQAGLEGFGNAAAFGYQAVAGDGACAFGNQTNAATSGICFGAFAIADASISIGTATTSGGRGSVAIGTDDAQQGDWIQTTIPSTWEDTVQIGRGTATVEGGMHFREFPVFTSAGAVITQSAAPSTASDTGIAGTVTWDTSFLYVCVATNTWKRAALATW